MRSLLTLLILTPTAVQAQYPYGWSAPSPPSLSQTILQTHNAVRAQVGVAPLIWSSQLAGFAQDWANHLAATHSFAHRPGNRYGENLYMISGALASPSDVVAAWAAEARGYNRGTNTCANVCGHYTQIVWRGTHAVGCAVASNGYQQVWVCEYDPPGNVVGYRPY